MIKINVCLIAVPDELCLAERLDLRVLMSRATNIEARLKKGVNIEDEQGRYQILCDRMENLGSLISSQNQLETLDLGTNYLHLLMLIKQKFPEESQQGRLMANFCPIDQIETQILLFEDLVRRSGLVERSELKNKIAFYKKAQKNHRHILELQDPIFEESPAINKTYEELLTEFLAIPVRDEISSTKDINSFIALRNQINSVIADVNKSISAGVNFSDISHNVITEILNEFVYSSGKPMYLPIVYGDGSKARPFPIHCLKKQEQGKAGLEATVLKVGMMSERHPEMDPIVKIYFFRNQEISLGRTSAETDEAAYQKAKEIFSQLRSEGIFKIAYYQNGFQPVIVGFYRALTEEFLSRGKATPTLEITPYFYFGEDYEKGKTWI